MISSQKNTEKYFNFKLTTEIAVSYFSTPPQAPRKKNRMNEKEKKTTDFILMAFILHAVAQLKRRQHINSISFQEWIFSVWSQKYKAVSMLFFLSPGSIYRTGNNPRGEQIGVSDEGGIVALSHRQETRTKNLIGVMVNVRRTTATASAPTIIKSLAKRMHQGRLTGALTCANNRGTCLPPCKPMCCSSNIPSQYSPFRWYRKSRGINKENGEPDLSQRTRG